MKIQTRVSAIALSFLCLFSVASPALAATSINLGAADSYAILAGSTVTNTGSTVINGDLGLSPGTSVTGFPPGVLNGNLHVADSSAALAQVSLTGAYLAASQTTTATTPAELGGTTKVAGVYESSNGTFAITGTLTLDAQGDPSAVFIFKSSTTLVTGGSSRVVLLNGAQACNVFWQVGSSATLGSNSSFKGTILAAVSATVTTGASIEGRVLTRGGAVTLDTSTVTRPSCATPPVATVTATATSTATSTPLVVVATSTAPVSVFATTTSPSIISTPTVIVPNAVAITPTLPDTGFPPTTNTTPWNTSVFLLAVSAFLSVLLLSRVKKISSF